MDATVRKTILIVDDTAANIVQVMEALKDDYRVRVASNGAKALSIACSHDPPHLILLDVMMPGMSGHEVCKRIKANPVSADIPVIFLTALSTPEEELAGMQMGAADYIHKPFSVPIIRARVRNHIMLHAASQYMRNENAYLESQIKERTLMLSVIQDMLVLALSGLAETRDSETGNHLRRVQHYIDILARRLYDHPRFAQYLQILDKDLLFKLAPLHDIGKVGIPDQILLKPGRLTTEEFEIMKRHPAMGREAIAMAERHLNSEPIITRIAKEIVGGHHERWDGSGYPDGLGGDDIPISARLMAVADVYDALICRRVYKEPLAHEMAIKIICDSRGSHFDPDVVDAFVQVSNQFRTIALTYN